MGTVDRRYSRPNRVEPPDVVDLHEIAVRLEVGYDTVRKWRVRGLIPPPDWDLHTGPVWVWETIRVWAARTGRTAD